MTASAVAGGTAGQSLPDRNSLSFWHDSLPARSSRPPLAGDIEVDVAILGGGYTGLWTAYYLRKADPSIRIAVIERRFAGFGASGRNGGWCSSFFPFSPKTTARLHGHDAVARMQRAMYETVDEVGRVAREEGLDIHYAKGGLVQLARHPAQLQRARVDVDEARRWGATETDVRLLSGDEAREIVGAMDVLGAVYSPHCATLHPARLVRGLAATVERLGVPVYEDTVALEIHPGKVITDRGCVRAETIVRATEAYTAGLAGGRRAVIPIYSLMVATETLPAEIWAKIRLHRREAFTDLRHLRIYGQRTADDRLAFGGRGAPYHFGSSIKSDYDADARIFALLHRTLTELFPCVGEYAITHGWGGPLAVARDWHASVGVDRRAGVAWAGGYVGDGVGTANLAGRTLADLLRGEESELTRLPWVGHRSKHWEPEPVRWIGVNAGRRLISTADRAEQRTGKPAWRAKAFSRFLGY